MPQSFFLPLPLKKGKEIMVTHKCVHAASSVEVLNVIFLLRDQVDDTVRVVLVFLDHSDLFLVLHDLACVFSVKI